MQLLKLIAVVSTTIDLAAAAPIESFQVKVYNSTLEARNHCKVHPEKNPDCRKGCGWWSDDFGANKGNVLVHTPVNGDLNCEYLDSRLTTYSVGPGCQCDFWLNNRCYGDSIFSVNAPKEDTDYAWSYRCHLT